MAISPPIVAIVGRPNVGKSTLFNRIIGEKRAIVEDEPGITRDRNYALVEKYKIPFILVDTGGVGKSSNDELEKFVREQAMVAIEEADILIALFDGLSGVTPDDLSLIHI